MSIPSISYSQSFVRLHPDSDLDLGSLADGETDTVTFHNPDPSDSPSLLKESDTEYNPYADSLLARHFSFLALPASSADSSSATSESYPSITQVLDGDSTIELPRDSETDLEPETPAVVTISSDSDSDEPPFVATSASRSSAVQGFPSPTTTSPPPAPKPQALPIDNDNEEETWRLPGLFPPTQDNDDLPPLEPEPSSVSPRRDSSQAQQQIPTTSTWKKQLGQSGIKVLGGMAITAAIFFIASFIVFAINYVNGIQNVNCVTHVFNYMWDGYHKYFFIPGAFMTTALGTIAIHYLVKHVSKHGLCISF